MGDIEKVNDWCRKVAALMIEAAGKIHDEKIADLPDTEDGFYISSSIFRYVFYAYFLGIMQTVKDSYKEEQFKEIMEQLVIMACSTKENFDLRNIEFSGENNG